MYPLKMLQAGTESYNLCKNISGGDLHEFMPDDYDELVNIGAYLSANETGELNFVMHNN